MKSLLLVLMLATPVFANDSFTLKSGDIALGDYLESASNTLGLMIDASTIDHADRLKVDVPFSKNLKRDEAMAQLLGVLSLQAMTLVFDKETEVYRVLRIRDARDSAIPVLKEPAELPDNDLLVTYIFKLEHSHPEEIARVLRSFAPTHARILPAPGIRGLIITDSARSIKKYLEMMKSIDQPGSAKFFEKTRGKRLEAQCDEEGAAPSQTLFTILFALIALIMGFMIRGYVIRRIEGGL